MKKFIIILLICIGAYAIVSLSHDSFSISSIKAFLPFTNTTFSTSDKALKNVFENKISGVQIGGSGKVIKILPDDNKGSRHQRFILKLNSNQTLLIAHNIDLAPKIQFLKVDDHVNFYGQYEWNSKGGVIHWTHHDPNGQHEGGWLNHDGKMYQ
ncbi:hypothetical protein DO021_18210 [Desulfobacter hydrogenophilus]|uniref:DUF3465 domain-containing protein n=1 Tax=Desulfobacter hydrogenophilus TaxID=2291 RepID=A0A328FAX5_9BACT|nr:DUF3465 domain-containing protein [Desulfobacter hydrogenophilus]NDY73644.1 DUF3465 domain-containing protein [Desulfobacter hydrogenophilus]QBH14923.1 DUF3465 domain-containing protein [Desulfobacter hydrogenophilus]RAM00582.1 hypothetical protein DO021_18210 [Desulfobacter hydrogenophilus]